MYTPSALESVILVLQVYTTLYKYIHTYIMCIYTYVCNYIYANKFESDEGDLCRKFNSVISATFKITKLKCTYILLHGT